MSLKRVLLEIAFIIIGILGIMVGEADDAPGAGLIGIILGLFGLYLIIKSIVKGKKKRSK